MNKRIDEEGSEVDDQLEKLEVDCIEELPRKKCTCTVSLHVPKKHAKSC
jgi:hypothetical protein